jgi:predicted RNA-binding protein associated with RNAse of E/G family
MHIQVRHTNLWGGSYRREMEAIYQSNKMVIARYIVENAQKPLYIDGSCVLENGYTAVSFIEYGNWYITEKIFNFQAFPTGFLARVVTPVEENLTFLATMDLFFKVWITPQSEFRVFGTKMFRKVAENGLLSKTVQEKTRETMDYLLSRIEEGTFPSEFLRDFRVEKKK